MIDPAKQNSTFAPKLGNRNAVVLGNPMQTTGFNNSFVLVLVMASAGAESAKEPFFEGLGSYPRKVSTDSPEAQKYFNQGLNFRFSFTHGAAIRAFQAAESAGAIWAARQLPAGVATSGRSRRVWKKVVKRQRNHRPN